MFRHNIRTETQIIMGYADRLDDADAKDGPAAILKAHAETIADLGEKAREIITIFEQERATVQPTPLATLLETAADAVREEHPVITVELPDVDTEYPVAGLLEPVFENALENAAEHNTRPDATVTVEVVPNGEMVAVRFADNGPGLDESEYGVLEEGTETALEHASGLGLWLIHWATEIAGGTVRFEENSPTGTVVVVEVPVVDHAGRRD